MKTMKFSFPHECHEFVTAYTRHTAEILLLTHHPGN